MREYVGDIRFVCLEAQTCRRNNPHSKSVLLRNSVIDRLY